MKKTIAFIVIFILFMGAFVFFDGYQKKTLSTPKEEKNTPKEQANSEKILQHYGEVVEVENSTRLYCKEEETFIPCGDVGKGVLLALNPITDSENPDAYFSIKDTTYFIPYKDVNKSTKEINTDYKNYVPFAQNIKMNKTILYKGETLAFEIEQPLSAPILIKDGDKKYIEYMNDLYYAKDSDIEVIEANGKEIPYAKQIAVLNYHFFYGEGMNCKEAICLKDTAFEEQMKYLADHSYYTPTMKEFEMYLDGKLRLPSKSVLLTVDDGAMGTSDILPRILEKYGKRASLFLITGWNDKNKFTSKSVELHSHSDALHKAGACPGGQGGGIKCLPEETVLNDLKKTRELLNNTTAFAYPFYEYNERAISLLQKAGFTIAFVGGNKKAYPGMNKMIVPRYPIVSTTTMKDFIKKIA